MTWHAMCELQDGSSRNLTQEEKGNLNILPEGSRLFRRMRLDSAHTSTTGRSEHFYFHPEGKPCSEHAKAWGDHTCSERCDGPDNNCPIGKRCGPKCSANGYPCPTGSHWRVSLRGLHAIGQQDRMIITPKPTALQMEKIRGRSPRHDTLMQFGPTQVARRKISNTSWKHRRGFSNAAS